MDVHILGWIGLAVAVIALISTDIIGHVRKPHAPSMKEATAWTLGYVALAVLFGLAIWVIYGANYAIQFYSGYMMEWSLSLDNLFVFVIIMASFKVPREFQQKALLAGIILALIFRAFFIIVGVTLVNRFTWMFFFFGAWLLWTAYSQAREGASDEEEEVEEIQENAFVRFVRRILPVTDGYIGDRFFYRHNRHTSITPLFLVVLALGSADLMFALDSIPAILGLTQEEYLVFACNAFALLGLRQLFFLIDGLLEKLVFLNYGLAVILGFIGVKLILHALHENSLPFLNGGAPIHGIPDIGIPVSLAVIAGTLITTVLASLIYSKRDSSRSNDR